MNDNWKHWPEVDFLTKSNFWQYTRNTRRKSKTDRMLTYFFHSVQFKSFVFRADTKPCWSIRRSYWTQEASLGLSGPLNRHYYWPQSCVENGCCQARPARSATCSLQGKLPHYQTHRDRADDWPRKQGCQPQIRNRVVTSNGQMCGCVATLTAVCPVSVHVPFFI